VSGVAAAGLPGDHVPVRAGGGGGAPQGPDEGQDQGLPIRSARSGTTSNQCGNSYLQPIYRLQMLDVFSHNFIKKIVF
jgi:hypothetical protein